MSINPYVSPSSEVDGVDVVKKRSLAWKVYFIIMLPLSIFGFIEISTHKDSGISEIVSIMIAIPSWCGFFGFVFYKKILNYKVWRIVFWVNIIWSITYEFITNIDHSEGLTTNVYIITMVISWMIALPYIIGMFLYGRKKCPVWNQNA